MHRVKRLVTSEDDKKRFQKVAGLIPKYIWLLSIKLIDAINKNVYSYMYIKSGQINTYLATVLTCKSCLP